MGADACGARPLTGCATLGSYSTSRRLPFPIGEMGQGVTLTHRVFGGGEPTSAVGRWVGTSSGRAKVLGGRPGAAHPITCLPFTSPIPDISGGRTRPSAFSPTRRGLMWGRSTSRPLMCSGSHNQAPAPGNICPYESGDLGPPVLTASPAPRFCLARRRRSVNTC